MRGLDPNDIDQLVTIRGMVIRATSLVPEMSEAFFRCAKCNHEEKVEIEKGRINEPAICRLCQVSSTEFYPIFFGDKLSTFYRQQNRCKSFTIDANSLVNKL